MKGSEKQIAWATEILENINKAFDASEALPASPAHRERLNAMRASINAAEYAGDIIHLFGHIHFNGDVKHDLPFIVSPFKIAVPSTEGEKKILMK